MRNGQQNCLLLGKHCADTNEKEQKAQHQGIHGHKQIRNRQLL